MRTVNKVILIGNITKDPFVKTIGNNKKIAMFTVATNRVYKDFNQAVQSEVEYTNCAAWGVLAERAEKFLVRGKLVYIEGRLKTRAIDKEDGTKLFKTEVIISNLIFLNKREDFEDAHAGVDAESDFVPETDDDIFDDDRF